MSRPAPTLLVPLALAACAEPAHHSPEDLAAGLGLDEEALAVVLGMSPLPGLPADPTNHVADDPAAAALGHALYFDPRLSGSGAHSCATCHDPAMGFGDGLALSEAAGTTERHAPHLWDVGYQRWFLWDGRCDSLWCQATGPLEAIEEMDGDRMSIARLVTSDPDLSDAYASVFGESPDFSAPGFPRHARPLDDPDHPDAIAWQQMDPTDQDAVTRVFTNVTKAIGAYERRLVTGPTRFDRFVTALAAGTPMGLDSLSVQEVRGLALFAGEGNCHLCHSGPLLSNLEFHSVGLGIRPWLAEDDLGRYDGIERLRDSPFNAAGRWSDAPDGEAALRIERLVQTSEQVGQFKTPSLRNITRSPPYMHGGHFETLYEVVENYARLDEEMGLGHLETFMVPLDWGPQEIDAVVAFLGALESTPLHPGLLAAPAPGG
ncbi:MAG: cytochrome c peroxidase [Myxococcota bacterium]|nr:cytochrome c peroxidase [Myxococcota bacterium]